MGFSLNTDNNNRALRVGVIGMGPVGCILAAHLKEAGAPVALDLRFPKSVNRNWLRAKTSQVEDDFCIQRMTQLKRLTVRLSRRCLAPG